MPCHPARARELLSKKVAAVLKRYPFTLILKRSGGVTQELELKIDPGSKKTGMALVAHFKKEKRVVYALNLEHRGQQICEALKSRRAIRRSRRQRKTRYRAPRFINRTKPKGWLAPSLQSRVNQVYHFAQKLRQLSPITSVAVETVRFDTQKIQHPEISGIMYQRGTLLGFELREYLLEKWERSCAYCDLKNVPLEIDHILAKANGGTDRLTNLTLSCKKCNQKKGKRLIEEFVSEQSRLKKIIGKKQQSFKDAAAVNSTRYAIGNALKSLSLPLSFWSGGRTKFNRTLQGYLKDHWIDAACVGESGEKIFIAKNFKHCEVKSYGRGKRQMCRVDRYGFPRTSSKTQKRVLGFQTGDLVKVVVTKGKKIGSYIGRLAVRSTGNFNLKTKTELIQGINYKYCQLIQRNDGYFFN